MDIWIEWATGTFHVCIHIQTCLFIYSLIYTHTHLREPELKARRLQQQHVRGHVTISYVHERCSLRLATIAQRGTAPFTVQQHLQTTSNASKLQPGTGPTKASWQKTEPAMKSSLLLFSCFGIRAAVTNMMSLRFAPSLKSPLPLWVTEAPEPTPAP